MEDILVYLILAGWGVMLFVPTFILAFVMACILGGSAGYLVHLNAIAASPGETGDLAAQMMFVAPVAAIAILAAWPFGAFLRWFVNRNKRAGI